jgi:hypothetical protein
MAATNLPQMATVIQPSNDLSQNTRLVISGLLLAGVVFQIFFFSALRQKVARGEVDFISSYTAGRIIRNGWRQKLYDYEVQKKLEVEINPKYERALLYDHPPFEALLFAPFARLPFVNAYECWLLINLTLLFVFAALLWRHLHFTSDSLPEAILFSLFAYFPICLAVFAGQDSILLLFLVALAFRSLAQAKDFKAGCILGLGLFRFQLILPLTVLFLLRRKVKFLLGLFSVGAVLGVISVGIVGYKGALDYITLLYRINHDPTKEHLWSWAILPTFMPTLRGFLAFTLSDVVPQLYLTVCYLALSFLIVLVVAKRSPAYPQEAETLGFVFGLDLVAVLVVSYHSHVQDLALLIFPLLFSVDRFLDPGTRPRDRKLLVGLVALLLLPPIYCLLFWRRAVALLFLAFLALGVLMWREMLNQRVLGKPCESIGRD